MGMVAQVGAAVQRLFGPLAAEAGRESRVIGRQRKFTALSLARTFVLGFLHKPDASDEELARVAVQSGAAVTPQAIDQRHTPQLVAFLEGLFRRAVRVSGRSTDNATSRQQVRRVPGTLRITDLGYFHVAVFAAMVAAGEHVLSRLQYGTGVSRPEGPAVAVLEWLAAHAGPIVDRSIRLGVEQRLACRLIAWRLPAESANRRRQKLRVEHRRKWGREPTAERLAWCDWTILVTSVSEDRLTPEEAMVLYRARWQIELVFKRWKSQNRVAELRGSTSVRQMVRVWARLLAAVVQHWLVVASAWGDPTRSWGKAAEAVRSFVGRLLASLDAASALEDVLEELIRVVGATCRRNRRTKPGTVELLNNVKLLDFELT